MDVWQPGPAHQVGTDPHPWPSIGGAPCLASKAKSLLPSVGAHTCTALSTTTDFLPSIAIAGYHR